MYATEYDLLVAADRCRDRRDEMKMICLASAAQAEKLERPSLLDRLMERTSRALHFQAPRRKVGAAA